MVKDLKGYSIEDSQEHITEEAIQNSATNLIPAGTVITCTRMALGKALINRLPVAINQDLKALICGENTHPEYLRYFLSSKFDWIISQSSGATVKGIKLDVLRNLDFPDISLPEQRRIAEILDLVDAARRKHRENLSLYDDLIRSLFLKTFGDPDKSISKEKTGELLHVKSGNGLTKKNMTPDGIHPVYGGNGVTGYHSEYMFENPQITIGRVGVYCGAVHVTKSKSWVSDNALMVDKYDDSRVSFGYLAFALEQANLNRVADSVAQPLISGGRIYPVEIPLPEMAAQKKFEDVSFKINAQKTREQALYEQHDDLFTALLQRAFKGEL